jgi:hypothetical protein
MLKLSMALAALVSLVAPALDTPPIPVVVEYPDQSEGADIWACYKSRGKLICLELHGFIDYMEKNPKPKPAPRDEGGIVDPPRHNFDL